MRVFEWPLKETKLHGSDIAFTVTHAPVTGDGPDSTTAYVGKITSDAMVGKFESEWSGHTFEGNWEARRAKD